MNKDWKRKIIKKFDFKRIDGTTQDASEELFNSIEKLLQEERERTLEATEKGLEEYANKMIEDKNFSRIWFKAHIHLGMETIIQSLKQEV